MPVYQKHTVTSFLNSFLEVEGRWLFLGGWSGAKSMGRDGGLGVWLEEGLGGVESGGSFSWCPLLWRIYFWNSERAS